MFHAKTARGALLLSLAATSAAALGCALHHRRAAPCRSADACNSCDRSDRRASSFEDALRTPPDMPTFTEAATKPEVADLVEADLEPSSAPRGSAPAPVAPSASESRPAASDSTGPVLAPVPERRPPPLDASADYRLRPGDRLDVQFYEHWKPGVDYRLLPGDQIHVEFLARPERAGTAAEGLDRTVRIQPDGKVAMPFLGVVEAAGRTVTELAELLSGRYERLYVDPQVLVTLVSTGDALADLRDSLRSAAGLSAVVAPDGAVRLPHLGPIPAAGLKTAEIEDEINERYSRRVPGFAATVRLAPPE